MLSAVSSFIFGPKPETQRPGLAKDPKPLPAADALAKALSRPDLLLLPSGATLEGYLDARWAGAWNLDTLGTPTAVVCPETELDVVTVVKYAAAHANDVTLGVACGRHSAVCMKDDVLVLDVRRFNSITVDPEKKTAKVGGGCLLGEVDQALKLHGLACTFGHDPTTGVGGLTLNGGHGFLERKYGLTIDNLISARVVVASGQVLTASEKSHPELFFGIRGGGGNFGVVLEFVFQCHELPNRGMLLGGAQVYLPYYPLENREQLLERYVRTVDACDELSGAFGLAYTPAVMIWVYTGEIAAGREHFEKHIWPYGWPVVDQVKQNAATGVSYWDVLQKSVQGPDGKNLGRRYYYISSVIASEVTPEGRAMLIECHKAIPGNDCLLILMPTGGKVSELRNGCIPSREARWWVIIQGSWGRDVVDPVQLARDREAVVAWVKESSAKLSKVFTFLTYGTLYTSDSVIENEKQGGSSGVYGDHLPRLRAVKKLYDPKNLFRICHNVLPSQ